MDQAKTQLLERIKQANNVLVTVSANPSVDQLAAAIGFTLMLHKLNKHATAVFSGEIPSTIEFLQPEETLEKNTDSLRDFIISLDRSKADKLRYKVEDKVVKIFITPYRTSISDKDLEFSQGDFNVDVVVALGVAEQTDLDQAITAHGRILHDATVMTISILKPSALGSINWQVSTASSLSELVASLHRDLGKDILDEQIATALLTGIVAETERFSNDKTSPETMSISGQLMSAGANQQLVATKLEKPAEIPPEIPPVAPPPSPMSTPMPQPKPPAPPELASRPKTEEGTLEVSHEENKSPEFVPEDELANKQIHISDKGELHYLKSDKPEGADPANSDQTTPPPAASQGFGGSRMMVQPPTFGSALTAETTPEPNDPSTDGLSLPGISPSSNLLQHDTGDSSTPGPASTNDQTLSQLDEAVRAAEERGQQSPQAASNLDSLRAQVSKAADESSGAPLPPIAALNAQTAVDNINSSGSVMDSSQTSQPTTDQTTEDLPTLDMPLPPSSGGISPTAGSSMAPNDSNEQAPPPVPPPFPLPPVQ